MKRAALVLALLALPHQAHALDPARTLTQYVHRIWQVQQGLPQAWIYAIAQTHDGYLWLGTQTGLVKFDGVRFTTVDEMDGVPSANMWVTHLIEDDQHALWIGTTQAGLIKLQGGIATRYTAARRAAAWTHSMPLQGSTGPCVGMHTSRPRRAGARQGPRVRRREWPVESGRQRGVRRA